ncbi:MAG: hypothetical protein QME46_11890 [Thermoanaerobacteraceae bacterium]|nr:hypothetical protein [Thermoanaerobacteraceae bacterium]
MNGTTKKIPALCFKEERKHLRPVLEKIQIKPSLFSITYKVRKDNTVPIKGNRYSVPLGTYKGSDTYVMVSKTDDEYIFFNPDGKEIARHKIASGRGLLIKNNDHAREKSLKIPMLMKDTAVSFTDTAKACDFLHNIQKEKPRYIRDQLLLVQSTIKDQDINVIDMALDFCTINNLYSAVDFKDALVHYKKEMHKDIENTEKVAADISPLSKEDEEKIKSKVQTRDPSYYENIFKEAATNPADEEGTMN